MTVTTKVRRAYADGGVGLVLARALGAAGTAMVPAGIHRVLQPLLWDIACTREAQREIELRKQHGCRSIVDLDVAALKKSSTVFVLGSGPSVNDLGPEEWSHIAAHDSIGFNYWLVHDFVPTFYFFEPSGDDEKYAVFLKLLRARETSYEGVPISAEIKHFTSLGQYFGRRSLEDFPQRIRANLYLHTAYNVVTYHRPVVTAALIAWRMLGSYRRFRFDRLIHHCASVDKMVMFAVLAGYREIVLVGVDLNSTRYFWEEQPWRYAEGPSSAWSGAVHPTVDRVFTRTWAIPLDQYLNILDRVVLRPLGIALRVSSRKSRLYGRFPLYDVRRAPRERRMANGEPYHVLMSATRPAHSAQRRALCDRRTANGPLVSILCPVFNCERFLDRAVESVLRQEYSNWELLLADDGSTDSSWVRILEWSKKDRRIIALHHPQHVNLGLGATRNLGMSRANGEYLACLDPDDEWLPHKLARQIDVVRRYSDAGLVYSRALCVDENSRPLTAPRSLWSLMGEVGDGDAGRPSWVYERLVANQGVFAPCPTVLVRADLARTCGGFRPGMRHMVEDRLLWTMVARLAPVYFIPEVLALWRLSADNWTCSQTSKSRQDAEWEYLLTLSMMSGGADAAMAERGARLIEGLYLSREAGRAGRFAPAASALYRVLAGSYFGLSGKVSLLLRLTTEILPADLALSLRHRLVKDGWRTNRKLPSAGRKANSEPWTYRS